MTRLPALRGGCTTRCTLPAEEGRGPESRCAGRRHLAPNTRLVARADTRVLGPGTTVVARDPPLSGRAGARRRIRAACRAILGARASGRVPDHAVRHSTLHADRRGLILPHPNAIVIHPAARIGANCLIFRRVTVAGALQVGGHVDIGAGANLLGPLTVGDHAEIGANAVVARDVAAMAVAAGVANRPAPTSDKNGRRARPPCQHPIVDTGHLFGLARPGKGLRHTGAPRRGQRRQAVGRPREPCQFRGESRHD